jgi:hypothetical protein
VAGQPGVTPQGAGRLRLGSTAAALAPGSLVLVLVADYADVVVEASGGRRGLVLAAQSFGGFYRAAGTRQGARRYAGPGGRDDSGARRGSRRLARQHRLR